MSPGTLDRTSLDSLRLAHHYGLIRKKGTQDDPGHAEQGLSPAAKTQTLESPAAKMCGSQKSQFLENTLQMKWFVA